MQRLRPGLRRLLDSFDAHPALVLGRRTEVLAANPMACALFADFERLPGRERNYARWMLLSDDARRLFVDWEVQARNAVESLRLEAAEDRDLNELVVDYETFTLPGDHDQTLFLYSTEPGSPSREAISILASWSQPTAAPSE
nr:hypothetical protein [Gordonia jinghuaiqii]